MKTWFVNLQKKDEVMDGESGDDEKMMNCCRAVFKEVTGLNPINGDLKILSH